MSISFANVTKSVYSGLTPVQDRLYLIEDTGELLFNGKAYNGDDGTRDWLCFTNTYEGTNTVKITLSNNATAPSLEYSTDGENWTTLTFSSTESATISLENGGKVFFRGDNPNYEYGQWSETYGDMLVQFVLGQPSPCTGSVLSLFAKDCKYSGRVKINNLFAGCKIQTAPKMPNNDTVQSYDYYATFKNCAYLLSAPELPAKTVGANSYKEMFYGCGALKYAPELPATTLDVNCYDGMFQNCQSLIAPPSVLPAKSVPNYAYRKMFYNCFYLPVAPRILASSVGTRGCESMFNTCAYLASAPELPALSLAQGSYSNMFQNCVSMVNAMPILPATTLYVSTYNQMFDNCSNLKSVPLLKATTLANSSCWRMFNNCSTLEEVPYNMLPATTVAEWCYQGMFRNCYVLKNCPDLPATTLAEGCYQEMFGGAGVEKCCALPATTLAASCYRQMFQWCPNITEAPTLSATTGVTDCYREMFTHSVNLRKASFALTSLGSNSCRDMFKECSVLSYVQVAFTDWNSANNGTYYWLSSAPNNANCVFVCPSTLDTSTRGVSTVPSSWTVTANAIAPSVDNSQAFTFINGPSNVVITAGDDPVLILVPNGGVTINAASACKGTSTWFVAYREVEIYNPSGQTITAGSNITFVDNFTDSRYYRCVIRWSMSSEFLYSKARLYIIEKM